MQALPLDSEECLSLKSITTKFGDQIIHDDISIDLFRGEAVVLLGASGCGKTTLMRGVVGLEKEVTGQCFFEGKNLLQLTQSEWLPLRKKIAFVFQYGALFDGLTVFENCAFPLREHTEMSEQEIAERVNFLLDVFCLSEAKDKLPSDISGGMQKRVGIARSLALKPKLLLLDEPTAGLDPSNTETVVRIVRQLVDENATVVIVSHDREAILKMADRLVLFEDGKIASDIYKDELTKPGGEKINNFLGGSHA